MTVPIPGALAALAMSRCAFWRPGVQWCSGCQRDFERTAGPALLRMIQLVQHHEKMRQGAEEMEP